MKHSTKAMKCIQQVYTSFKQAERIIQAGKMSPVNPDQVWTSEDELEYQSALLRRDQLGRALDILEACEW